MSHLDERPFQSAKPYYTVLVDGDGLVVTSECCADRMDEDTARAVHDALGRWLATRPDMIHSHSV